MLKMFMWDAAIMRYPVFYKKKTFHGLFFEENWNNAGNITFVLSHWKT